MYTTAHSHFLVILDEGWIWWGKYKIAAIAATTLVRSSFNHYQNLMK